MFVREVRKVLKELPRMTGDVCDTKRHSHRWNETTKIQLGVTKMENMLLCVL